MDTVAVDVGTQTVDLAKWNGRELHVEKLPTADPVESSSTWLELLEPQRPFRFSFSSTLSRFSLADSANAVLELAVSMGAARLGCGIHNARSSAAGGARWYANRHRMGPALCVECGITGARGAHVDESGVSRKDLGLAWQVERGGLPDFNEGLLQISKWITQFDESDEQTPLICGGGLGPMLAARMAEACGRSSVLIPDYAGCLGVLGSVLAPEVFQVDKTLPPQQVDVRQLRGIVSEMMDQLADKIARTGYDFDDVICDRFVGLAREDQKAFKFLEFRPSDDEDGLIGRFCNGIDGRCDSDSIEMRCAMVRATVDTRNRELPPPGMARCAATHALGEIQIREFAPIGKIVDRVALAVGRSVDGPAVIREPFHVTVVSEGWRAEIARAGGILLTNQALSANKRDPERLP